MPACNTRTGWQPAAGRYWILFKVFPSIAAAYFLFVIPHSSVLAAFCIGSLGMQQLRRHVCKVRVFTINVFAANEN
jgi:hypothetical protein